MLRKLKRIFTQAERNTRKPKPSEGQAPEVPPYPIEVILELTNNCNLRCVMCHIHSEKTHNPRKKGFMEEALWRKVISELSGWDFPVNLNTFGGGEALLHPQTVKVIQAAKQSANITAGFLTNGMLLTPEKSEALIDAGIDWLAVSLDSTEAEFLARYRVGARLDVIEKNIQAFLRLRNEAVKKPILKLNMVLLPEGDVQKRTEDFLNRWLPLVDEVMLSAYRPIGQKSFLSTEMRRRPCHLLYKMMVIAWNGDLGLCCEDNFIEHRLGSVMKQSLGEIWTGREFSRVRELDRQGLYDELKLCALCDVWASGELLKEFRDPVGRLVRQFPNQTVYTLKP